MNNSIYIIGGGNSLKGFDFDLLKDKTTIAINKSMSYVPNLNYFITMDFTALRKINSIANLNATKIFIANFTVPYLQEQGGKIVDTRFNLVYRLEDFDMIIKSHQTNGIGLTFKEFTHGANSGFCALQLAIILGYTKIYLLGIDLNIEEVTHFHGGYGETKEKFNPKLDIYYKYFQEGILLLKKKRPDIQIYSCSSISKLNNILNYHEF